MNREIKMPAQFAYMSEEDMTYTAGGSVQGEVESMMDVAVVEVLLGAALFITGCTFLGSRVWKPDFEWEYSYRLMNPGATEAEMRQAEEETMNQSKQQVKKVRVIGGIIASIGVATLMLPLATMMN